MLTRGKGRRWTRTIGSWSGDWTLARKWWDTHSCSILVLGPHIGPDSALLKFNFFGWLPLSLLENRPWLWPACVHECWPPISRDFIGREQLQWSWHARCPQVCCPHPADQEEHSWPSQQESLKKPSHLLQKRPALLFGAVVPVLFLFHCSKNDPSSPSEHSLCSPTRRCAFPPTPKKTASLIQSTAPKTTASLIQSTFSWTHTILRAPICSKKDRISYSEHFFLGAPRALSPLLQKRPLLLFRALLLGRTPSCVLQKRPHLSFRAVLLLCVSCRLWMGPAPKKTASLIQSTFSWTHTILCAPKTTPPLIWSTPQCAQNKRSHTDTYACHPAFDTVRSVINKFRFLLHCNTLSIVTHTHTTQSCTHNTQNTSHMHSMHAHAWCSWFDIHWLLGMQSHSDFHCIATHHTHHTHTKHK